MRKYRLGQLRGAFAAGRASALQSNDCKTKAKDSPLIETIWEWIKQDGPLTLSLTHNEPHALFIEAMASDTTIDFDNIWEELVNRTESELGSDAAYIVDALLDHRWENGQS